MAAVATFVFIFVYYHIMWVKIRVDLVQTGTKYFKAIFPTIEPTDNILKFEENGT